MPLALTLSALLVACPSDTEDEPGPEGVEAVVLPQLSVTSPERGAFYGVGTAVRVKGQAIAGTYPLAVLTVDGEEVDFDDQGRFEVLIDPIPGVNRVGLRIEDEGDERAVDGRSFYAAARHENGETIAEAVRMQLGPEVLDDDTSDLDDLSAILEVVLLDPAVSDVLVGETFVTEDGIEIEPTYVAFGSAAVDLSPAVDRLDAVITLYDVWMDFNTSYSFYSTTGSAWMSSIVLTMGIEAEVTPSGAEADVVDVDATLYGYGLTVDWFPDWLEDELADWTKESLEDSLGGSVEDMAGEMLSETLDAFAVEYSAADGVDLGLELAGIDSDRQGLYLTFDAWVEGSGMALPSGAASLTTSGAVPSFPLSSRPFAVALDDDLLNQVFFAFWASGAVHDMTYGPVELAVLVGEALPPPLGPVEQVVIDLGLPPVVAAGSGERPFVMSVGELTLDITRDDGERTAASLNFSADADLTLADDGSLVLELDDRPKYVPVDVGMTAWPEPLDPGDLASLFRLMTPTLVGSLGDFLPSFGLPPLPLDALGDVAALEGEALVPGDVALSLDDQGWFLLEGELVPE